MTSHIEIDGIPLCRFIMSSEFHKLAIAVRNAFDGIPCSGFHHSGEAHLFAHVLNRLMPNNKVEVCEGHTCARATDVLIFDQP